MGKHFVLVEALGRRRLLRLDHIREIVPFMDFEVAGARTVPPYAQLAWPARDTDANARDRQRAVVPNHQRRASAILATCTEAWRGELYNNASSPKLGGGRREKTRGRAVSIGTEHRKASSRARLPPADAGGGMVFPLTMKSNEPCAPSRPLRCVRTPST